LSARRVAASFVVAAALAACGDDATGSGGSGSSTTDAASSSDAATTADAASSSSGAIVDDPPYVLEALDDVRISSHADQENFQNAEADLDFGAGPFQSVKLVVDLSSTCFPFENWNDNPPPSGENWPADCDAYDRNFEMALFDPSDEMRPGLELVRAITPFGGPMHIEADVTDLLNGMPGTHRFRTHITTWSDGEGIVSGSNGGWNVSAHFEVDPGPAPRNVLAVIPLFYGGVTSPSGVDGLTFEAPEGTTLGVIEYRVTGHGGAEGQVGQCIGPAEEFCFRDHEVDVDGVRFADLEPQRGDCAELCTEAYYEPFDLTYCAENPCGARQSVRASRANWCPGSVTPPFLLQGAAIDTPGPHTLSFRVPLMVAEGGLWQTSATFVAYGD
jgi:hypothetical protein